MKSLLFAATIFLLLDHLNPLPVVPELWHPQLVPLPDRNPVALYRHSGTPIRNYRHSVHVIDLTDKPMRYVVKAMVWDMQANRYIEVFIEEVRRKQG